MLTNVLEDRNPKLTLVLKLKDALGRSIRENIELFSINDSELTFVTESDKVIKGHLDVSDGEIEFNKLQIESADIFKDQKKFDSYIETKVSELISNLNEDSYSKAKQSFSDVLTLWETQLQFNRIKNRLVEKTKLVKSNTDILNSDEFKKVVEIKENIIKFLTENKELLAKVPEVKNSVKLSNFVSKSFKLPKLTLEQLAKEKTYSVTTLAEESVFELICKQELLSKELYESKLEFESIWASNPCVAKLIGSIFEKDENVFISALNEAIQDIPYFALATKKQLNSVFSNSLKLNENSKISDTDLTKFVSKIYEAKKPVKEALINLLNEKYGINVTKLQDTPSFKNLVNTQVIIFEALAKLSPKNSVQKQTLSAFSKFLRGKSGIEGIDINDFINELFDKAGYKEALNESNLLKYMDFSKVAADLGGIGDVLKMLAGVGQQMGAPMSNQGIGDPAMQTPMGTNQDDQFESDETLEHPEPDGDESPMAPKMSPEDAAMQAKGEYGQEVQSGLPPEQGQMGQPGGDIGSELGGEELPPDRENMEQDDLVSKARQIQDMLADLLDGMGLGGEQDPSMEMGEPDLDGIEPQEEPGMEPEMGGEENGEGPPPEKGKDGGEPKKEGGKKPFPPQDKKKKPKIG